MANPVNVIQVGDFVLRVDSGELLRGNARVPLQEKPMQVLLLLVERGGQLVTREDLRNRLWPADTFVDFDRNLNTAVKKLRIALGDSAEKPRYVETIPRRGYRLIMPVRADGGPSPECNLDSSPSNEPATWNPAVPSGSSPWAKGWRAAVPFTLVAVFLGLLAMSPGEPRTPVARKLVNCPAPVTLALLPFQHEGRGAPHSLSVELNEGVARQLVRTAESNLRVFSGRTVQEYLCSKKDFRQMGQELGVAYVLEGNVRRAGNTLRVTAQLFETRAGSLVVAESVDVPAEETTQAMEQIASRVAGAIIRCLVPPQRAAL